MKINLYLEGIIDSVSRKIKEDIYNKFNNGISKLDNEMIRTMEVFFKCGLNLSEAAKELYIHRNTLIYRLDKIEKYTNYDIREFNEAVLLKIIFFIWKEKMKKILENVFKIMYNGIGNDTDTLKQKKLEEFLLFLPRFFSTEILVEKI